MTAQFIVGDALTVLKTLDVDSVDLVITSPPFLALRSYLPADHPDKDKEMGSEPDPGVYVDALMLVVEQLRRVLAPHGSLCIELGDTYAGSGGGGGDYLENGLREGQPGFGGSAERQREGNASHWRQKNQSGATWPLPKSLSLVPEITRLTMAYGRNPLTGRETEKWRIRNVIRWVRPNPPVGALGDKFRPATSEMLVACTSAKRYFDLDAVRGDPADVKDQRARNTNGLKNREGDGAEVMTANYTARVPSHPAGAPPLDWWKISTRPYKGAHYAAFPEALVIKPIKSMCPERVCRVCGEPSRRMTEPSAGYLQAQLPPDDPWRSGKAPTSVGQASIKSSGTTAIFDTVGWSDCGHDDWRPGLVLDPFAGTGTVLQVATGHSRDAIGIDLDPRNADLALDRVGPLLLDVVT